MKMDQMNQYFKNRGFSVKRFYNTKAHMYNFEISKGESTLSCDFQYPCTNDYGVINRAQKYFLEATVNKFEELFCKDKDDSEKTVRQLFDTLTPMQKSAVFAIVGEAIDMKEIVDIKDVIFNPPATIVFWQDGTKTVVKAQDEDIFDPEKGLAMAISKKALGNNYSYYNPFKKWIKKYEKQNAKPIYSDIPNEVFEAMNAKIAQLGAALNIIKET